MLLVWYQRYLFIHLSIYTSVHYSPTQTMMLLMATTTNKTHLFPLSRSRPSHPKLSIVGCRPLRKARTGTVKSSAAETELTDDATQQQRKGEPTNQPTNQPHHKSPKCCPKKETSPDDDNDANHDEQRQQWLWCSRGITVIVVQLYYYNRSLKLN